MVYKAGWEVQCHVFGYCIKGKRIIIVMGVYIKNYYSYGCVYKELL